MKIEVLGMGCPRCHSLEAHVRKAVSELKVDADIAAVTSIDDIVERGVMMTPALAVDGKVVLEGKLPGYDQVKKLIQAAAVAGG